MRPRFWQPLAAASLVVAVACWSSGGLLRGQEPKPKPAARADWGPWLEDDAPFFSSVLDARRAGATLPKDNLSPRALVLRAAGSAAPAGTQSDLWLAFDPDLLRVAAVWRGKGVTPTALAPGSYHQPDKKTPGGQTALPTPDGPIVIANGIYPGWQAGERPSFRDPRSPAPSPEEVGRGPIAAEQGRFTALRLTRDGAVLEYEVAGATVQEWVTGAPGRSDVVIRHVEVAPTPTQLWLILGVAAPGADVSLATEGRQPPVLETMPAALNGAPVQVVRVPPHTAPRRFAVAMFTAGAAPAIGLRALPTTPVPARWPVTIATTIKTSASTDAYVVDDVPLPVENPWRRGVRVSDIQFLADGTGACVTLDGDVWIVKGLASTDGVVQWRRFASGLHEPLTLAIRDEQVYVFDRNGVWRLRDTDADGEADRHELFSNAFAQTADMREFPSTIRLGPQGEFVIAKGGQEATTIGKHNGSVLRLSADGRTATVLGYGLRQPQLAVHPQTGLVTASDQQGHYIPSTPLHIVRDRQFYGFLSDILPKETYPAPIAAPIVWIPHEVNASGMSQVWLLESRMGPLDNGLVHIGYNRPELFRVLLDLERPMPQAAVVSLTSAFDYPPLNGAVNPADGQLYIAGFQVLGWGTTATRLAGLGRVRYTGAPVTTPRQVTPMREGVLLRFDLALDTTSAGDVDNYVAATWGYKRTFRYGSPNYKADGTTGTDTLVPSRAYVSADGRGVFVAIPDMKPVMQLQVGWKLRARDGRVVQGQAYSTPYSLEAFNARAEGFGDVVLDLTRREAPRAPIASAPASVDEGREIFVKYGCLACHATERGAATKLGPPLAGVFGAPRTITGRTTPVVADESYLRQSIREPSAAVVSGFDRGGSGMPSFAGVLSDTQVESVVLFLKSLK
jgi:glucose/arabinose dehydrogenase/cytochrome c2